MRLFQLFEHIGHGSVLTSPAHTVVVDTPSDLDWYKLGQHFPTLMNQDPREFNAGSSDTVVTFANKEEADKFRALMKLNGVKTMDIGGSHIHPEIHSDNPEVDETIRKVGNKYRLYSKKGKNLGTYDSREAAEEREQQVNYFKHMDEKSDTLELPDIEVGDEVMVGKFKNRKAVVTGFENDEHNQPVLNTTKGNQKLFKPRLSKLVKE